MKTPLATLTLSLAAALAAVNAHAQQNDYFQEVAVGATTSFDSFGASSGHAGSGMCGDACGPCGDSCGGCGNGCGPCCCCESPFIHRSGFFGEFLLLRPRDQEIALTVPSQNPVVIGNVPWVVPQGRTVLLDPDYQPGYRVGATVAMDCDSSVMLTYTNFESQSHNGRTATANEVNANINIYPLLMHPATLTPATGPNVAAAGEMDVDFELIDLDARLLLFNTNNFAINGVGGVRWAHFNQDVIAAYTANGGTIVLGDAEYDGIGGRGGFDAEFRTASGFGAYGKSFLSLLYGAGRGSYQQFQLNNPANPQVFTDGKYDRTTPILDLEVGVQWLSPQQRLRLSAGYLSSIWFNMVTVRDYMVGVTDSQFDDFSDTVTFDGLTARAEVRW